MCFTQSDEGLVEREKLWPTFGYGPEYLQVFKECWRARLAGVANFHSVVEHGYAVHRKNEGRRGKRAAFSKTYDGALLVVVVGETHFEGAFRISSPIAFPCIDEGSGGSAEFEDVGKRGVEGPGVVEFESFQEQFGLICFSDHDDVGLDFCEFGARRFPKIGRHVAGNVAAESVRDQIRGASISTSRSCNCGVRRSHS